MTSIPERPIVVFDLDGTVVNTWRLHLRTCRVLSQTPGFPGRTIRQITEASKSPTEAGALECLFGESLVEAAGSRYQEVFNRLLAEEASLTFSGIRELLASLKRSEVSLILFTGRSEPTATRVLAREKLDEFFDATLTSSRPPVKPSCEVLKHEIAILGRVRRTVFYVTDNRDDLDATGIPWLQKRIAAWGRITLNHSSRKARPADEFGSPGDLGRHLIDWIETESERGQES